MNSSILSKEITRVNSYKLIKQVVWGFLGVIACIYQNMFTHQISKATVKIP